MRRIGFTIATATLLFGFATDTRASAAEIAVLAAAAIEQPFETVVHAFEHDTGTPRRARVPPIDYGDGLPPRNYA
jgi:ABC-type molybdate transport system substrate-binding protein